MDMSYRALNGFIDSGKSILDLNGFINLQFDCGKTKQLSQKRQVQKISRVLKACEKTKDFFSIFLRNSKVTAIDYVTLPESDSLPSAKSLLPFSTII